MDYSKLSHDDLIEKCKELNLDYLTKQKKPKSIKSLLSLLKTSSVDIKTTYEDNYSSLETIIDKCHNFLYTKGITGSKAQNDIMKFFTIFIINHLHKMNNEYILNLIEDYKKTNKVLQIFYREYEGDITKVQEKLSIIKNNLYYLDYLKDISLILKPDNRNNKGDENDMWKMFVQECLSKIFPDIYSNEDYILHCKYKFIISNLISIISKFTISDLVIDEVQSFNGDIHEKFLKYQGNKNSKELGQFFTPREIIKSILNDCGFKKLIEDLEGNDLSIYDPCLGTGGLLCYTYNSCKSKIKPETIYGCEIEADTMKLGIVSLMISTNNCNKNIKRCNSLIENPYLFEDTKFDIIFTNPPFGTKTNYKQLEGDFEDFKKNKYPDSSLKFKDIYKISGNTGIHLFIQNIIYLLKIGGIACIILPDGELMVGKSSINIRKFILDNCRILKIITINAGAFANTNIKTKALIIQKGNYDNYNQEIEYIDIQSNGIDNLGFEKLNENLQFNITKVEEEKTYGDDIKVIEFGKMFNLIKGTLQSSKVVEDENGEGVMINWSIYNKYKKINDCSLNGKNLFISSSLPNGKTIGYMVITYYEGKCDYCNLMSLCKLNEDFQDKVNIKYIYYLLKDKQEYIEKNYQKGCANKSLDIENFNKMKIPIPPLERQVVIVDFLDSLNEINHESKNKIEKLKRMNDLYLKINLIQCEIKTIEETCYIIKGDKIKSSLGNKNGLYPLYYCSILGNLYLDKYTFDGYGIIINRTNGSGKCMIYLGIDKYNVGETTIHFKADSLELTKYIYYYLRSNLNKIEKYFIGANQKSITDDDFKSIKIPIPSLEKQKEIIEYLDYNNDIIKNLEKEIEYNNKFFKQIL
jgi:type I restriction-modification system DNA methylase subunit